MSRTLGVIALDAADLRLVREWDCENLMLDDHAPIETYAHSYDHPHTIEVWSTVATGLGPEEHGILVGTSEQEWEHPIVRFASDVAEVVLPSRIRNKLGDVLVESGVDREISPPSAELDHVFDELYQWPGLTDAEHMSAAWSLLRRARHEPVEPSELEELLMGNTRDEFAWLAGQRGLAGVHSHVLDVAGHVFCNRSEALRDYYERIDQMVGWLRHAVDDLVVLSDHGMQVGWLDDDDPGQHSWNAYVASTLTTDLPDSVGDVASWLDRHRPEGPGGRERPTVADTPAETLEYLYGIDTDAAGTAGHQDGDDV